MKNYTVYLAPDCHECDEVQEYVRKNNIDITITHLSQEEWVEKEIFIFPVLMKEKEIIAYGIDILKYLK